MLNISQKVRQKLASKKVPVTEAEIRQCFANADGDYLYDQREEHQSDPPTRWFIAETDFGRKLKVVFIPKSTGLTIRSAFDPNADEIRIYNKYGY